GFSDCTPGRFLLPGDMAGSPVLTFAPLPPGAERRGSLAREFARRYEAYKSHIVKPFFRDHFARIDRQIVLVDALGAIHAGPRALADLRQTMAGILQAFRPGTNSFLSSLMGKRVERILFAATKADHLHHAQHDELTAIMDALVRDARDRADFAGAKTGAMSIAAIRATTEETREVGGRSLGLVRGRLLEDGRAAVSISADAARSSGASSSCSVTEKSACASNASGMRRAKASRPSASSSRPA
ncbi:MAG: YcjX family protein, partial [Pseudomonadota bacterium]